MSRSRFAALFVLPFLLFVPSAFAQTQSPAPPAESKAADALCTRGDYTCACGWDAKTKTCANKNVWGDTCMAGRPCEDTLVQGSCTKLTYCKGEKCFIEEKWQACEKPKSTPQTTRAVITAGTDPVPHYLTPTPLTGGILSTAISGQPPFGAQQVAPSANGFEQYLFNTGLISSQPPPPAPSAENGNSQLLSPAQLSGNTVALSGETPQHSFQSPSQNNQQLVQEASTFVTPNSSAQVAEAAPAPCTSGVWTCWASQTWDNIASGKIFSWSVEAHPLDAQARQPQPTITTLATRNTNAREVPASLLSPEPAESAGQSGPLSSVVTRSAADIAPAPGGNSQTGAPPPVGGSQAVVRQETAPLSAGALRLETAPFPADLDVKTPAQLKAIQDQQFADRIAQAQAQSDAAKPKAAGPQPAQPLKVLSGVYTALQGGGTDDLKVAWKEYVAALDNNSRANPVTPVQVAELPPVPGAEQRNLSAPVQVSSAPTAPLPVTLASSNSEPSQVVTETSPPVQTSPYAPAAPAPQGQASNAPTGDELLKIGSVFDERLAAAKATLATTRDALSVTKDIAGEGALATFVQQAAVDTAQKRLDDVQAKYAEYAAYMNNGGAAPAWIQTAVDTARGGEGLTSGRLSAFSAGAEGAASEAGRDLKNAYESGNALGMITGGLRWTGWTGLTMLEQGIQTGGEILGAPGFNPDETRAYKQAIDPTGQATGAAFDVGATTLPFLRPVSGLSSLANKGIDAVVSSGESAIVRGEVGTLGSAGVRAAGSDIVESGTGAGAPARANPGADAFNALTGDINAAVTDAQKQIESLGQLQKSGTIFDTAPGGATVARAPEKAASVAERAVPSGGQTPSLVAEQRPFVAPSDETSWWSKSVAAGGVGAFTCSLYGCFPSTPPPEAVPAEILSLSKDDMALLFPSSQKTADAPAPTEEQNSTPPRQAASEASPRPTSPPIAPAEQTPAAAPAEPAPPTLIPPVLAAPPASNAEESVPVATTPSGISLGTPESEKYFDERQKNVEAQIRAQAQKNEEEQQARDAAERQRTADLYKQAQQQALNNASADATAGKPDVTELPLPVMTSEQGADTQGVGPVSTSDIVKGLEAGDGEGSRRKDLEVNFKTGSAVLEPEGRTQIANLAAAMKQEQFNGSTFAIVGHTDTVGTPDSNLVLSRERAQEIVNILHSQYGIPLNQMTATGAGQWQLKVPVLGDVPANRRVEIIVTPRR